MSGLATRTQVDTVLEAIPVAIIALDSKGAILLMNSQAESLLGYHREELIGEPVERVVPGPSLGTPSGKRASGLRDSVGWPVGTAVRAAARRKDGSGFAAEISVAASQLDGRELLLAAISDVTARNPEAVKFRGVIEGAEDAVVGLDPDGLIALVNPQAEELFGYTSSELVDKPVDVLVPQLAPDTSAPHELRHGGDQVNTQLGEGEPLAVRRKDGSEFPAEISLAAIDTTEGPLVSAVIRDAGDLVEIRLEHERSEVQSERDRVESQLHQSHRLESLGQLAGGVAHDFNNLLAAILNYVGFVSEEIATEIEGRPLDARAHLEAVLSDVNQIGEAAERAARLTHQLLAFARREVRNVEVLDVNAIVSDVDSLLRRTLGEHVELTMQGARDLMAVRADRGQIEQILLNLAVNARDAMPTGGTLTVTTENLAVAEGDAALHPSLRAGPHVRLRVTDSGLGMDRETVDRAFEPFFSTKTKDKGTGLGLATVYGIVTQTGGVVDLHSEIGVGTTVTILLPAVASAVTAPDAPRTISRQHGDETILIVEDEDMVLDVASRILTRNGYHVLAVRNGGEALTVIDTHREKIHLLLTDVVMPGMTGKEFAERVFKVRPEMRVLYMSGYPESVITSQGVVQPGIRLVAKPFKATELLGSVRAVLDA